MKNSMKLMAALAAVLSISILKSQAQVHSKAENGPNDTVTYVLYGSRANFDDKRTVVLENKKSIDSLLKVLANEDDKLHRIVFQKEHHQGRVITAKYLKVLNTAGVYKIAMGYNKRDEMDEQKPIYILTSK